MGYTELVDILIQRGEDPNVRDKVRHEFVCILASNCDILYSN